MDVTDKTMARYGLLSQVARGRLTPKLAEDEAVALGIGSLLPSPPDPSRFNPNRIDSWSLLMAVSWIAFRKIDIVRWSWNPFYTEHYDWKPSGLGYEPRKRKPRWLHTVPVTIWDDELSEFHGSQASFAKGYLDLVFELAGGRLVGKGRDIRTNAQAGVDVIRKDDWSALQLGSDGPRLGLSVEDGPDMLHFGDGQTVYTNVTVDREGLLTLFPEVQVPAPTEQLAPQPAPTTLSPTMMAIKSAIDDEWDGEVPAFPTRKALYNAINDIIGRRTGRKSGISSDTFQRFFKKIQ